MSKEHFEALLKKKAPTPRELPMRGSGGLHGEQQYCFEKGWKEGIAAYRKMLREAIDEQRIL